MRAMHSISVISMAGPWSNVKTIYTWRSAVILAVSVLFHLVSLEPLTIKDAIQVTHAMSITHNDLPSF